MGLRKCRDGQSKLDGMCSVLLWQVQGKLVFLFSKDGQQRGMDGWIDLYRVFTFKMLVAVIV